MTLRLGTWPLHMDEKGRFPIPAQVRRGTGDKRWVFGLDSEQTVVLFPQAALIGKNLGPDWHLAEVELDGQNRVTVPDEIKESGKLQHKIKIVSASGDRLQVLNADVKKHKRAKKSQVEQEQAKLRPFKSGEEANQWLSSGDPVAYYSRPDRVIVGQITSGNGSFFTLKGKDKSGVFAAIHQVPFPQLYPLRQPDETARELIRKFPSFNPAWPGETQRKWFDDFLRLVSLSGG